MALPSMNAGRSLLKEAPIPLFIPGNLGVAAGPGSDGVLIGTATPQSILRGTQGDYGTGDPISYTNKTTAANNGTANDVIFFPTSPAVDDRFNVARAAPYWGLNVSIGTKMTVPDLTVVHEYLDVAGAAHTLTDTYDGTSKLLVDATGVKRISWVPPTAWAACTVDTVSGYWTQWRISVFASLTTNPLGTQLWALDFTHGTGIKSLRSGTLRNVRYTAGTKSAANGDTVLLIVNWTRGTWATVTLTKATCVGDISGLSMGIRRNDEIGVVQISQDGSTEFANVTLYLDIQ